jgi:hypothetical protein
MSEAEIQVKEKYEAVYTTLKRQDLSELDWEQIRDDLAKLNWLVEDNNIKELITAVWSITEQNAVDSLEGRTRFRVLKLSRVRVFVTTVAHNITSQRDDLREICSLCKKYISDFSFFTSASQLLTSSADLAEDFKKIVTVYEEAKSQITSNLIHLDKSYSIEIGKGLGKSLDEGFYSRVISPNRTLLALSDAPEVVSLLNKYNTYPTARTTTYSGGYSSYPYNSYQQDSVYLGELDQDNKREGFGKCTYYNGDNYEGYWSDDRPHGLGVYTWRDGGRYEGEFVDGKMQGKGKRTFVSKAEYTGEFRAGKKHGVGSIRFKNGDAYVGGWDFDDMSGDGVYTWHTGDKFTGKFSRDKREGPGVLTLESGEEIVGEWIDGKMKQSASV